MQASSPLVELSASVATAGLPVSCGLGSTIQADFLVRGATKHPFHQHGRQTITTMRTANGLLRARQGLPYEASERLHAASSYYTTRLCSSPSGVVKRDTAR